MWEMRSLHRQYWALVCLFHSRGGLNGESFEVEIFYGIIEFQF